MGQMLMTYADNICNMLQVHQDISCALQRLTGQAMTHGNGALLLQRNYDLHRALAGKTDSLPAAALASIPVEPMDEDDMEEGEAGPSGNATEDEEDVSAASKQVNQ